MKVTPPKRALNFLRWFCREDYIEEIEGDLTELFEKQYEQSPGKAKRKFVWSVIKYFRPELIKSFKISNPINPSTMFRHNLLITYRNFLRHKGSFFINLIGLSTGLASVLLIYLWVNDEMSVDKFHEKDDRLYQVMERWESDDGIGTSDETSGPVAEALVEDIPEIEYAAAVAPPSWRGFDGFILSVDERNVKATGQYVGKDYFNIFSFELLQGHADYVLANKSFVVISDALALKLFNTTENILGKTVALQHEREFVISGVFRKVPTASSVQFDFVMPFQTLADGASWVTLWTATGPRVYVVVREGTDVEELNKKIAGLVGSRTNDDETFRKLFLARYSDLYLHGNYENGVKSGGRIEYVRLFSIVALFTLIIACINFMNLSTARSAVRIKEVGVKKAFGVGRSRLAFQYISESVVITVLSMLVALLLVAAILPQFNLVTGKQLGLTFNPQLIIALVCIALVTGVAAGSYPALYLSRFNPVTILKGKLKASNGELWVRQGLVAFQFTLSIILIVSVFVVYQQIEFIHNKNLGFNKDNVIYFDVEGRVGGNTETFLSEIKKIPGIVNAASTTHDMTGHNWATGLDWEGKQTDDWVLFQIMGVSHDFLETLGIELKEGRFFSKEFSRDTTKIIFNEAAIEVMGFKDPIGKRANGKEIIGVVKNFHFESLHEDVKPQFFVLHHKHFAAPTLIMVRIEAGKEKEVINTLDEFYQAYNPGFPLDYTFLDEDYEAQYAAEQRVSTLSGYFAALAIIISCLGLFGLVSFTTQRRLREIGIRKILGASEMGIVYLLSNDISRIVILAIAIAIPVSYFISSTWLENFTFRIELTWWFFAGAGLLALMIAWMTVGMQTIRAAKINPTQSLKSE